MAERLTKPPQLGSKTGHAPRTMAEAVKMVADLQEDMRRIYNYLYGASERVDPLLERLDADYQKRRTTST